MQGFSTLCFCERDSVLKCCKIPLQTNPEERDESPRMGKAFLMLVLWSDIAKVSLCSEGEFEYLLAFNRFIQKRKQPGLMALSKRRARCSSYQQSVVLGGRYFGFLIVFFFNYSFINIYLLVALELPGFLQLWPVNLTGLGIKPRSPALAGGSLTTGVPGKSRREPF